MADDALLAPHGTEAAARRHYRRGEPLCPPCREANARAHKPGAALRLIPDLRATRNGLPDPVPYAYGARRYPWANRILRAAEAVWGAPEPTCVCGGRIGYAQGDTRGTCADCGETL